MADFHLPDEAWAAAAEALRALGRAPTQGDRIEVEFYCDRFLRRRRGISARQAPARYAEAWRSVSTAADELLKAIDHLREIGAAELEPLGLFAGGDEIAKSVRLRLPELSQLALVVAEIEAEGRRTPARADPARDELANALVRFWLDKGGAGTTRCGPASRFLEATFSEALVAANEERPKPDGLRHLLRKYGELGQGKAR
jgi:hypothetical protein